MADNDNTLTLYETVRDRYGKKHRIYSVRFKDLQIVTEFTEKYNPDAFGYYALAPVMDEDGNIERKPDGSINYDNGFLDDLYEMVGLALDHRETREQIEEWLDLDLAKEIIKVFLGLSSFKKKTEVKKGEETHWRNVFASLVKNTSLTMEDLENMRLNQFEDLLTGLEENAKKEEAYIKGGSSQGELLEGDEAIHALLGDE